MNKEEKEAIEKFRYGAPLNYQTVIRKLQHDKITDVAITRKEYIDTILNYIDKLQKENDELQADKNKLINYIAIRENKTYEEVCKEFEV